MSRVAVVTERLSGSALGRAMAAASAPEPWSGPPPRSVKEWQARVADVREQGPTGWLEHLAPAFNARGPAADRLARCAAANGVVVTTGQQAGLFGGPMYTWVKALSALALADALEAATGVPTAPVFWAATDDADFAESSWTMVASPQGAQILRLPPSDRDGVPMSSTPLGDVSGLLAALRASAGSGTLSAALETAEDAYRSEKTVGGAYVALLRGILNPLGIAVLDPSHPAFRRAASPLLRCALVQATEVDAALRARNEQIRAAGFEPQVSYVAGRSLVFSTRGDLRRRVTLADAGAVADAAREDELGANVLLRPVVERSVLPTVAYVAGPAELAYFAQVRAVADALRVAAPIAVPRWSATIVEPHVARTLARLGVTREDLADPHAPERRLAEAGLPPAVATAIHELRAAVDQSVARMRDGDSSSPSLLPDVVLAGAHHQLDHRIDRLLRRYLAAMKRRQLAQASDLAAARGSLYPGGRLQERALNFLPLLARYGGELLDEMQRQAAAHAAMLTGAAGSSARAQMHTRPTDGGVTAPSP